MAPKAARNWAGVILSLLVGLTYSKASAAGLYFSPVALLSTHRHPLATVRR
jgi:hypothetical protein